MEEFLTFRDVAVRMQSEHARIQVRLPYWNRRGVEGTSIGFFHFCEWFEVNVHDAQALAPEEALKLLESVPGARLDNSDTDDYGQRRWFGGGLGRRALCNGMAQPGGALRVTLLRLRFAPVLNPQAVDSAEDAVVGYQDGAGGEGLSGDHEIEVAHELSGGFEPGAKAGIVVGCSGIPGQHFDSQQEFFDCNGQPGRVRQSRDAEAEFSFRDDGNSNIAHRDFQ
jgi:hypothetical protein